jgi:hypothetical protein
MWNLWWMQLACSPVAEDTGRVQDTSDTDSGEDSDVSEDSDSDTESADDTSADPQGDGELFVMLVWSTPGGPGAGVSPGSDATLHLRHPSAVGQAPYSGLAPQIYKTDLDGDEVDDGWFSIPYDAFGPSQASTWGCGGCTTDFANSNGPEERVVREPEAVTYRVGVDYWSDGGFGVSDVKVRIFVDDVLLHEATATLSARDFWEVADIQYPGPQITPILRAGAQAITPEVAGPR